MGSHLIRAAHSCKWYVGVAALPSHRSAQPTSTVRLRGPPRSSFLLPKMKTQTQYTKPGKVLSGLLFLLPQLARAKPDSPTRDSPPPPLPPAPVLPASRFKGASPSCGRHPAFLGPPAGAPRLHDSRPPRVCAVAAGDIIRARWCVRCF
jgi:hypothetical protein